MFVEAWGRVRVSPEERSPAQASYGDIGNTVPVQIHDSMDGLAKELCLVGVAARTDMLQRWKAGPIRASNRGGSGLRRRCARSHDSFAGFCPF